MHIVSAFNYFELIEWVSKIINAYEESLLEFVNYLYYIL